MAQVKAEVKSAVQYEVQYLVQQAFFVDYAVGPPLYEQSGNRAADLPLVQPGDRFDPVSFTLKGLPFSGRLKHFSGAAVQPSPEIVNSTGQWGGTPGTQRGFIVDFGGLRSILRLVSKKSEMKFVLVLPWLGTDFARQSLYPPATSNTPNMTPHASGASSVSLRGSESQKLFVQVTGGVSLEQFLDNCVLETGVFPAQLRASLGDQPPFWTFPGPLQGEAPMTGLAEALTAFAASLEAPAAPKLLLQTDAPGVLELPAFTGLQAEKSAAASWAGSDRVDLALQAGVPLALTLHFPEPVTPQAWTLRSLQVEASPDLEPWIVEFLSPEAENSPAALRIDARLGAAQSFTPAHAGELRGVSLLLGSEAGAELGVEFCSDAGGKPDAAPLATQKLIVQGPRAWRELRLDAPLPLMAGARIWVVLKAKSGSVLWTAGAAASAGSESARLSEEGTAWRPYPPMIPGDGGVFEPAAGLRLLRMPRPEENQARLVMAHAAGSNVVQMELPPGGETAAVEWLWPEAGRPDLPPGENGRALQLTVHPLSSGNLALESATVFFHLKEG